MNRFNADSAKAKKKAEKKKAEQDKKPAEAEGKVKTADSSLKTADETNKDMGAAKSEDPGGPTTARLPSSEDKNN